MQYVTAVWPCHWSPPCHVKESGVCCREDRTPFINTAGQNQTPWFSGCQRDCVSYASVCHHENLSNPWLGQPSCGRNWVKSDLSCPKTQLYLWYATWLSGNMTPESRLETRFIHIVNEEVATNTAASHKLCDVSNIPYPCNVFISTSVNLVQWWENSQVFIQNQCLTVAFIVISHEHVPEQCSVWMRISQLAFTLLGPELEAVLLNSWDTEDKLLH